MCVEFSSFPLLCFIICYNLDVDLKAKMLGFYYDKGRVCDDSLLMTIP